MKLDKRRQMEMKTIRIAAAVIVGPDGKLLLVRKRGTKFFMQPGGKIDVDESPQDCLVRELREELDLKIDVTSVICMGQFEAAAANEPEHLVHADVYIVSTDRTDFHPAAEIEEIRWVSPNAPDAADLASLTGDYILPAYRKRSCG
jgi:8-oxo-dGTP pyrophosphatase MutT (NUDIX family)